MSPDNTSSPAPQQDEVEPCGRASPVPSAPQDDAFWALADCGPGCWVWKSYKDRKGYGLYRPPGAKTRRAHRYAYELARGPIPPGLVVMHSCDNPSCVNPAHLTAATQADNIRDKHAKGRAAPQDGERNAAAKWSDSQIAEMRTLKRQGIPQRRIAKMFGASEASVSMIVRGKSHTGPYN